MSRKPKCIRLAIICIAAVCVTSAAPGTARAKGSKHPSQAKSKSGSPASGTGSQVNPNSLLLPDSTKPTFKIPEPELRKPVTVIAYGDMRFTNPKEKIATDPKIRMELVRRVAKERPDVLLLNGDVPYHGGVKNDYLVYKDETRIWRVEHLRVFPVLGNHEFYGCAPAQCLENWWNTFPKLKDRRWYSVQVGTSIYVIALDSDDSLESGSRQIKWLTGQLDSLSPSIKFVMINLHHPPVADPNPPSVKDKVPRPNEIALRNYLRVAAQAQNAKFVVTASHIHNYERFYQDSVMYLVTGGGGAVPYPVIRTPGDLYKDPKLPNYNYVEFVLQGNVLRGTMYRLSSKGTWQAKDTFDLKF